MLRALLLFFSVTTATVVESGNWAAGKAELANLQAQMRVLEDVRTKFGQAPFDASWSQESWCDALADHVEFLLVKAHAPMLAVRMSCSLEECSGVSQQVFQQTLAAGQNLEKLSEDEEGSWPTRDAFACQRSSEALAFLQSPQALRLPRCASLASKLAQPERGVAHERLFLAFLACQVADGAK